MGDFLTIADIQAAASAIQKKTDHKPRVGMILGSGLGSLAESIENPHYVPYGEIPGWPVSGVKGHAGRLVLGSLEGQSVVVMQGRTHYYEGYDMPRLGLPVRVMQALGIEIIVITNAAGAVNPSFEPGDLMLITDHLNLIGMAGQNPLRGPNLEELGPRFPDMSQVYDRQLLSLTREVAAAEHLGLREGVYCCLAGPSFETPADLRFLRAAGVDAVGMSTVPEATIARHSGTRVLGVSGISNKANLDGETETTHEEVLEAGKVLAPKLTQLVRGVLRKL
ncbi:MAG: purine-nucleoside phosphorylase [Anaerolineales bacterium]|nr:purine-nucleoside phosphorylase [Anaerolineales bacterium]QYK51612.1 MAG: purine-nucleoside phosphorylase [Anaerolineales bacterium]